jgi:hypothetical protein
VQGRVRRQENRAAAQQQRSLRLGSGRHGQRPQGLPGAHSPLGMALRSSR